MKYFALFALCVTLMAAGSLGAPTTAKPAADQVTVESLKARVHLAQDNLLIIYETIEAKRHGHLLGAIKNLRQAIQQFAHRLDRHDTQFYLGEYAHQLDRFESRIKDEIFHVLSALNGHKRVDSSKQALIIVAHELVDKANTVMKRLAHSASHGHTFDEMKSEISQIEKLMVKIGSAHGEPTEQDSAELYRHELTMAKLLQEFNLLG